MCLPGRGESAFIHVLLRWAVVVSGGRGTIVVADVILILVTWFCLSRRGLLNDSLGNFTFPQVLLRDGERRL